jgi:hypothetical protein
MPVTRVNLIDFLGRNGVFTQLDHERNELLVMNGAIEPTVFVVKDPVGTLMAQQICRFCSVEPNGLK